jgi:hypothetical protein
MIYRTAVLMDDCFRRFGICAKLEHGVWVVPRLFQERETESRKRESRKRESRKRDQVGNGKMGWRLGGAGAGYRVEKGVGDEVGNGG